MKKLLALFILLYVPTVWAGGKVTNVSPEEYLQANCPVQEEADDLPSYYIESEMERKKGLLEKEMRRHLCLAAARPNESVQIPATDTFFKTFVDVLVPEHADIRGPQFSDTTVSTYYKLLREWERRTRRKAIQAPPNIRWSDYRPEHEMCVLFLN